LNQIGLFLLREILKGFNPWSLNPKIISCFLPSEGEPQSMNPFSIRRFFLPEK
jgi:hypothetical protein